ncbi:hypothetical protein QM012_008057 [Aureobasidium pullulans]|uniref:Formamidopyrimidine-DNA glycosylase catalytic domain-containing protein n=1 Tax=Aureobasidium pullulans TaxID=5580 RepID=A0ABR0TLF3_AURPU
MPEIGEVARIVHFLRKHCANKVISAVQVQEDNIVYGKVGTSATAFQKAMTGKKILDAKQQGKYFWLEMEGKVHPVMHLGMTGWIKFKNDDTSHYYRKPEDEDKPQEWPPRFWKFILQLENDSNEIAFVDPRRLARIRVVEAEAQELRNTTPLKENGPDPVIDKDILTEAWLEEKLKSKKVPVKALMLDQANISGIGNWVADEILYQARIHPEQYSYTFSSTQVAALHKAMMDVCGTAVGVLADSKQFPETWLMKYRWDKGKKDKNVLPNGDKIVHLKVGGRTSAIVPRLQKKTGKVAGDVDSADEVSEDAADSQEEAAPKKTKAKKAKKEETASKNGTVEGDSESNRRRTTKRKAEPEDEESEIAVKEEEDVKPTKKRQTKSSQANGSKAMKPKNEKKQVKSEESVAEGGTRRRSGRLSGKGV